MRTCQIVFSLLVLFLVISCSSRENAEEKDVLARVNEYALTRDEFQRQLASEMEMDKDFKLTKKAKEDFLEGLIKKELLIQEAKKRKLDRNEKFITAIERYWESTLIRDLIEMEGKEIIKRTVVSEEEIEARYRDKKKTEEVLPPLEEIKDQVTKEIMEEKKSRALEKWIDKLRRDAKIEINQQLLSEH